MNEAQKLIKHLEAIGHGLNLEGDNLRIMRGKHLPPSIRDEVINHKKEIISVLKRDSEAKAAHFIVGIPGILYMRSVSCFSTVYIGCEADKWQAWRETYQQGRAAACSFKTINASSSFGVALLEAEKYFQYIENKNKQNS